MVESSIADIGHQAWHLKQKVLTGSSVNWVSSDGSILFHFNARPDQKIIYLNSCPIDKGWNSEKYQTIEYDGASLVEAKVCANEIGFTIFFNG